MADRPNSVTVITPIPKDELHFICACGRTITLNNVFCPKCDARINWSAVRKRPWALSEIHNGHPYTTNDDFLHSPDHDDYELVSDLPEAKQKTLLNWIKRSFEPAKQVNRYHTSYGLKHIFDATPDGFYVTNNQFKDAMLLCGFEPHDKAEKNWHYRITEGSIKRSRGS